MNQIRVFRMIALAEGVSFLTLLFIAMPMKYFMGMPEVVRVVGSIHGLLFILYVGQLARVHFAQRWPFMFSLYALIASVVPFGTFMLDKQLRKKEVLGPVNTTSHFYAILRTWKSPTPSIAKSRRGCRRNAAT